jgi:thiol-disulfide isomerase/thioredoxin
MAIRVNSPEEFDQEFVKHNGLLLALFTGSKDPQTGQSWCPDCVSADPHLEEAQRNNPETTFLYCEVGPRESWKNQPGHPYRTNPNTRVRCVPTLIRYQSNREIARLEEGQLCHQDILNDFFK